MQPSLEEGPYLSSLLLEDCLGQALWLAGGAVEGQARRRARRNGTHAKRTHYTWSHITHTTQGSQKAYKAERGVEMAEEEPTFILMSVAELRQWVEANPGRVNDRDGTGFTPLTTAVWKHTHSLVVWLLDEKGADVNATDSGGDTALHVANAPDIVSALLDRGADTARVNQHVWSPLMQQAHEGTTGVVARLLQDPRVRATVNMQSPSGATTLHYACLDRETTEATSKVHLFLQAGSNPTIPNKNGLTPLGVIRQHHPNHHAITALLEQTLAEAEKAALLVKARRLAVAANSNAVAPSCLQARVARGQPLPHVALMPLTEGQNAGEGEEEEGEEGRKLRTTLAFMCGLRWEVMPRDVFRVVMTC